MTQKADKFVGKKLIWADNIDDEDGVETTFLIFEGGEGLSISDNGVIFLDSNFIKTYVATRLETAKKVLDLEKIANEIAESNKAGNQETIGT